MPSGFVIKAVPAGSRIYLNFMIKFQFTLITYGTRGNHILPTRNFGPESPVFKKTAAVVFAKTTFGPLGRFTRRSNEQVV